MLYNKRIKLLFETSTKVNGRPTNSIIEYYTCCSNVSSLSSTMQYKAMQSELQSTILFNIKYCNKVSNLDSVGFKDKLFVEYRGKKYKIYLVDMHQYNHQDITLKGIEVI